MEEAIRALGVSERGYSQVVAVDLAPDQGMVFVSGQVAIDGNGDPVGEGDFEAQCRYVLDQLRARLESAGCGFEHVVKVTAFLRDFDEYPTLVRLRQEVFRADRPPASSAVAVSGLVDDRLLIEIEAIAVAPRGTKRP